MRFSDWSSDVCSSGLVLGAGFLGQVELVDRRLQLGDVVTALAIIVAELALDRFQLFVEIIFALALLHLPLHAAADLLFDLEHAEFADRKSTRLNSSH